MPARRSNAHHAPTKEALASAISVVMRKACYGTSNAAHSGVENRLLSDMRAAMRISLPIVLSLSILSACQSASPPVMYVVPENTPKARLANGFDLSNGIERIEFSVSYGNICKFGQRIGSKLERVFTVDRSNKASTEIADIRAAGPVRFFYYAVVRGNRYCVIEAEAILQAGQSYIVKSDVDYGGIFSRGACAFAIQKAPSSDPVNASQSGEAVSLTKLDIPHFCVSE
jgi:hypothetical protein